MENSTSDIDPVKINDAIRMLKEYVHENSIEPLISLLEALSKDPENESLLAKVSGEFNSLDVVQGAVLTYAPYVWIMLSEDPFGDDDGEKG